MGAQDIDVELVRGDVRVVLGNDLEPFVPIGHGMDDAVGLGGRGQMLAFAGLGQFKGIAHDPLAAAPGKDALLDDELVISARV